MQIMIASIDQAFEILDSQGEEVPFEAIEFLRSCPAQRVIEKKIIDALSHVYDDPYCEEHNRWYSSPVWYAVVAETHITKSLIAPVISLFTSTDYDWALLNEQGAVLISLLAQKYPDEMMEHVTRTIDALLVLHSHFAYLFLFDAFVYADVEKYKDWFLQTLQDKRLAWIGPFAIALADLQIKEALPSLKKLSGNASDLDTSDIQEAIEQLETGINKYPDQSRPYFQVRGDWKKFYTKNARYFTHRNAELFSDEYPSLIREVKVSRNSPCPCGSGKKYKKCCLLKIN